MNLIEINLNVKCIVIDTQVYLRVGPNCWYIKDSLDYLAVDFDTTGSLEKTYQETKEIIMTGTQYEQLMV